MKTLTFIPVVFVILTLYFTSVELHSTRSGLKTRSLRGGLKSRSLNGEPKSHSSGEGPKSHSSGKGPKSHSSGKGPKGKTCLDSFQCPNGTACLPAGNGEGSGNSTKKCQPCGCRSATQCRKSSKEVFCDCSNSGYTGSNCETEIEPTTTTTTPRPTTCPDGWLRYGSHCYKYFSTPVDWDTAKAKCESLNAYLVEITSEDEEAFIYFELAPPSFWIALSDVDTEGTFVWAYSGEINSNDFQNGYTAYNTAAFDCVNLEDLGLFTWYTSDCARKIGYICERPL